MKLRFLSFALLAATVFAQGGEVPQSENLSISISKSSYSFSQPSFEEKGIDLKFKPESKSALNLTGTYNFYKKNNYSFYALASLPVTLRSNVNLKGTQISTGESAEQEVGVLTNRVTTFGIGGGLTAGVDLDLALLHRTEDMNFESKNSISATKSRLWTNLSVGYTFRNVASKPFVSCGYAFPLSKAKSPKAEDKAEKLTEGMALKSELCFSIGCRL